MEENERVLPVKLVRLDDLDRILNIDSFIHVTDQPPLLYAIRCALVGLAYVYSTDEQSAALAQATFLRDIQNRHAEVLVGVLDERQSLKDREWEILHNPPSVGTAHTKGVVDA